MTEEQPVTALSTRCDECGATGDHYGFCVNGAYENGYNRAVADLRASLAAEVRDTACERCGRPRAGHDPRDEACPMGGGWTYLAHAPETLDVERLSIAMNRAYTYGTGTAEQVAAEYARLIEGDTDAAL